MVRPLSMSSHKEKLPNDIATCHELLHQQGDTIGEMQQELDQLKHYVNQLVRHRFGSRSEKYSPDQMNLFDEPETEEDPSADEEDSEDEEPPATTVTSYRRGGGRNKLPDHLPRERVEHDLTAAEKLCPCCNTKRQRIGEECSEQLEFIPASLKVIEHIRFKYACKSCEEHVCIAPAPTKPIEKGLAGAGLLATILVGKYSDHLPLYRHEEILARHGVELNRSTMCRWVMETAESLQPLLKLMQKRVLQSSVIHTDDTTIPVQDKSLPRTRTGRFWVYCGDAEHPYSVYDFTPTRQRAGPESFLENYQGYLQADAYAGYEELYRSQEIQQVSCWAHARRKFFDAKTVQPGPAHRALLFIKNLYGVEREAKVEKSELQDDDIRQQSYADRFELRQEKSLPILKEFYDWLKATVGSLLPKSPVAGAIGYLLNRWDSFTRYCSEGMLSIDNNLAERTMRPCALGRKNYLFVGSDRGGHAAAVHYSLMASCKANDVEPFAYVRDVLNQIPTCSANNLCDLLPDVWLSSHPTSRRLQRHR